MEYAYNTSPTREKDGTAATLLMSETNYEAINKIYNFSSNPYSSFPYFGILGFFSSVQLLSCVQLFVTP